MKRKRKKPARKISVIERPLGRERVYGLAWIGEDKIEIDKKLKGKAHFSTCLHECLHLFAPDASETKVLEYEKLIANALWELGYRRVDL